MALSSQLITKTFLEIALNQYFKNNVNVINFAMSNAVPVGENFGSDLVRIIVTYSSDDRQEKSAISVIAKSLPEDETTAGIIKYLKCFQHELGVYSEVLPAIKQLDNPQKIAPEAIYIQHKPTPVLVLEDLTTLNYEMSKVCLDLDHCLIVVKKMAYLHASSAVLYEKNKGIVEIYKNGTFSENDLATKFITVCYASLIETCEKTPDLHQFVKKLKLNQERIVEKIFACNKRADNFNVLNHGDCWTNNFMFTYEENGKPNDVLFLDFQYPFFSSPAIDLLFFWTVATSLEVKTNHREEIINHYFEELIRNLRELPVKAPTRQEFDENYRSSAAYGFAAAIVSMPILRGKGRSDSTLANYLENEKFRLSCFNNEECLKEFAYLLPFYDTLGVFD